MGNQMTWGFVECDSEEMYVGKGAKEEAGEWLEADE